MAHKTGVLGSYWSQCEGGLSRQKCVHFSARFLCLQPSHRKVKICYFFVKLRKMFYHGINNQFIV